MEDRVSGAINLASDEKTQLTPEGMDYEEFELRKRLPRKLPKMKNDIYVTTKTNFKAQLRRCKKLLENGRDVIYIHGLGNAIDRAINIALQLKAEGSDRIDVETNTSTVEMIDDLEPIDANREPQTQSRNVSAIHIRVFVVEEFLKKTTEEQS